METSDLPTKEELDKIKKAQLEADPTKFSPLNSDEEVRNRIYGKYFYRIVDKRNPVWYSEPEISHMITLLSKGILHVSDIVKYSDQSSSPSLYSKEMPLDKMKPGKVGEVEAEIVLLNWIFRDYDKSSIP